MAAPDLKPIYVIGGSDQPKVELAVRRLRRHFPADATELHLAAELSGDEAVAACNALGLFGGGNGRLIVVDGVQAWKAADAKAVEGYVKSPTPGTVLALVGDGLKADAALAKACAKVGDVLIFEAPRERDLPGWVARQFETARTPVDSDACRALIEIVGDDLQELTSEIDKIVQWAAGDRVTVDAVSQLASAVSETASFELTDAWGRRDVAAVLRAAEEIIERSPKARRDEVARLASTLAAHVDRIHTCRTWDSQGVSSKEAATRMKRHPFYVQKLYAQARNFGEDELRDATLHLAALDHALKGGSRLSAELELERALIEITQPAGVAGGAPARL
jgi:DNA polymerase III subunit delta